ncbi:MAG: hypothetical protein ACR2PG_15050 [Hyphomicrobiaceae bacterium]
MNYHRTLGWLLFLAFISFVASSPAFASSTLVREVQTKLYAGQTAEAASNARSRLNEAPGDDNARFYLGAIQFLQPVEQLGQGLHRYGLQSTYEDEHVYHRAVLTGLPILRLPVPENPKPDELTYEAFRGILITFAGNLKTAEATLGEAKSRNVHLPLNIGHIRLDLDGDGTGAKDEALWRIFAVLTNAGVG